LGAKAVVSGRSLPCICYFHGNGDQLGLGGVYLGALFSDLGFAFFAVEYPGYGLSGDESDDGPSEASILRTTELLLRYLENSKGVARTDMVLVGQSIGCAPALRLASQGFGRSLVLLSPFTSLQEMASEIYPFLRPLLTLAPFFLQDKLENSKAARAFPPDTPVLILHGTHDEVC